MNFSKAQTSSLSEEGSSAGFLQFSPVGLKLEAVMEQLQRQQEAKLDMNLQEKHLLQAQLILAQHAAAAGATGSKLDSALFGKAGGQNYQAAQHTLNNHLSRIDPGEEEEDSDEEGQEMIENDKMDDDDEEEEEEEEENGLHQQANKPRLQQVPGFSFPSYSMTHSSAAKQRSESPPSAVKQKHEENGLLSPAGQHTFTTPNSFTDCFDDPFKQRSAIWAEENDGGKVKGEPSRDFAKLYELDNDPQRKEFLDELFVFMQKRGTPVNRIPIMAKQVLDLFRLYKLVTEKGGLVEVINRKIWREITKGLNLPTSITSAAFTLRTQYMKYLYPFECEKKGLSSPGELQAAIDSNRREGRRPSYTNSLYRYSPSPSSTPHALLSSPTVQTNLTGQNGLNASPSPNLKRNTDETPTPLIPSRLPMTMALGQQGQAATLEHLKERLERGAGRAAAEGPEKKMMRLAEEQQRVLQQALQQNLLAMASHLNPMNVKITNGHESKQDLSVSLSTNGTASISVSVTINGTIYSGTLFAQTSAAPVVSQTVTMAGTSGFSALSSSHSPSPSSSTSSKGQN
ncbi:AT-rich interactive domain-containing protein 3B [Channa argus]|uniref:AT-rich interactive domain-containing protein 3 n=1 Tax=Channa argus TaxID=215402 RepID=A0A6G1PEJ4_CHAAH|nr:AT-rich interactive domain-containing protein 3B [Channa argus]